MARLNHTNIKRISKNRSMIHELVEASYTVFEQDGNKYFQIDTYGKANRENPEKISQSFQIDQKTACFLVDLLSNEFSFKL